MNKIGRRKIGHPLRDTGKTPVVRREASPYRKREAEDGYEKGEAGVRPAKHLWHSVGSRSS
ncbi:hypothetical protein HAX54_024262, partial [Datura stramonium]|nr:hypothetical protein [Datura stramonium]